MSNDNPTTGPISIEKLEGDDELARLLLNSSGEGIYGVDLKGNCTFANPACAKLLGFENTEELLGKQMHELVHHTRANGEPYPVQECRIYQAFQKGEGTHVDNEVMFCADGKPFPTEYWSFPVERDGELAGCVVTFVDISERRRAEEEKRKADELVRLLLNSTGEGIYGIDLEGHCTFANPACATLLGFENTDELLGKQMHELVHHTRPNGEPYPVQECQIYQAFQKGEGTHVDDEVMFCSNGKPFPTEYWSFPVERDGELVGCVVTFVDITERRKVENELRQSEKMAALGKLSAGLTHEINNPAAAAGRAADLLLGGLDGLQSAMIELARAGIEPELWPTLTNWQHELNKRLDEPLELSPIEVSDREEELVDWLEDHGFEDGWDIASILIKANVQNEDLDSIADAIGDGPLVEAISWLCKSIDAQDLAVTVVRSLQSISELVNVVKSYSYMDRAAEQYVDIHQGLEDTIKILHHKLKKGIEVVRDYDRDLPQILTRGSELNQVWTNLMDNAIGAMGEKGTITLRTYKDGDFITVEISDNGPGIPKEIQSRIFDPFFTTKDVGEGTGLGLDVVHRIISSRCGGQINLRSEPGETTFEIKLPLNVEKLQSA